jgi:DNA polymerase-3 subunit gamma/tau
VAREAYGIMAYLALYRVWRPQKFDEVVGQAETVMALKNAVKQQKLSHAYIFAGPRGTGKTSIAKILARAVNCEHPIDGNPCNQCLVCEDIKNGSFMDVIEIDAASNRGIDEIRDLREQVRVLPAQGKTKVYIIDEVHMLTTEAFNALLKTLEEPPARVMFILATTEAHKIPPTIISRCQKFNFYRLSQEQIESHLQEVAAKSDLIVEPEALQLIARRANGGMRDALGMLDQAYAYKGATISRTDVLEVLGLVDDLFIASLMEAVINHDVQKIITNLDAAFQQGKEARQIARESCLYLRDLMIYALLGEKGEMLFISGQSKNMLKQQKEKVDKQKLLQALEKMLDLTEKLKFNEEQRFSLEMAFLDLSNKIFKEHSEDENIVEPSRADTKKNIVKKTQENHSNKEDSRDILWKQILMGVKEKKIPTHALLSQGKLLGTRGDTLYIGFKRGYRFHKERMEEKGNREILEETLRQIFNRNVETEFIFLDDSKYNDIIVKKAIEYFGEEVVEVKD